MFGFVLLALLCASLLHKTMTVTTLHTHTHTHARTRSHTLAHARTRSHMLQMIGPHDSFRRCQAYPDPPPHP